MSLGKEFKKFVARGNVVDLAVGVVIGAAFSGIVTQLTEAVDHTFSPADMIESGRHLEGNALLRAVKAHAEHRIFINSGKTVVFAR